MIENNVMNSDSPSNKEIIKNIIFDMVKKAWDENNLATLVAHVGTELAHKFDLKKDLEGQKLAEFIKNELLGKLRFIDSPKDPMIKALIPADAEITKQISDYFLSTKPKVNHEVIDFKRINFERGLWKAFSSPLQKTIRYIRLEPEIYFEDSDELTIKPEHYVIAPELIVPKGSIPKVIRDNQIQNNIIKWLKENSIETEKVKLSSLSNRDKTTNLDSVFSLLIKSLDEAEIKRIVIPLDILIKLQNTKV